MSHYFENDSNLKSQIRVIPFDFKGYNFNFYSDNGVFSKNEIDEGSITLLNAYFNNGKIGRTLDVGSGLGVLGITISKINNCEVDMLEINERAVNLTKKNIEINSVDKCNVYESNIYEKASGKYEVIVSNPPIRAGKKVVFEILEKAYNYLEANGELWIVIRKNQGADSAKKKLIETFNNCEVIKRNKGFYVQKCNNISVNVKFSR